MGSISSQRESSRVYTPILPMGGMLDFLCNRANQKISWILGFFTLTYISLPFHQFELNIWKQSWSFTAFSCCKFHNFVRFKKVDFNCRRLEKGAQIVSNPQLMMVVGRSSTALYRDLNAIFCKLPAPLQRAQLRLEEDEKETRATHCADWLILLYTQRRFEIYSLSQTMHYGFIRFG